MAAPRLLAVALLLATPLLAGCGGPGGTVPERDAEGRYVIHATADFTFEPKRARVPAGATVVWVVDGGAHDVNAVDGSFTSNTRGTDEEGFPLLLGPGDSLEHTFPDRGTWEYWCHTHHEEGMRGLVVVE